MNDLMAFLIFMVPVFAVLGIGAWWSDKELEELRPPLPPPEKRAVVGESHKPWM